MSKRVLKWVVPVDDRRHEIGAGPIVHIGHQGHVSEVVVWTEQDGDGNFKPETVEAQVFATGTPYPNGGTAVGSVIHLPSERRVANNLVWHLVVFP